MVEMTDTVMVPKVSPVSSVSRISQKKKKGELLFSEYYALHDEYTKKYGRNVAIFMQVGKFYELYAPPDYSSSSNIREIASLLNCKLTWKEGHRMGGFPLFSLDKNLKRLTENDYTIVVVNQVGTVEDEKQRRPRKIVQVVSKGTNAENSRLRNNIMSIYYRKYGRNMYTFGLAVTDTTISKSILVHEIHSLPDDKGFALDTVIRFVAQYDPVECIITTQFGDNAIQIQKHLGLTCSVFNRDVQDIDETHMQDCNHPEPIKYALGALKTFLAEHMVNGESSRYVSLDVVPYRSEEHLDLCSTAIKQLDIPLLLSKKHSINHTVTPMGNRLLTERLYCPTKSAVELQQRYDAIDSLTPDRCTLLRNVLKEVPDLARLHRWMSYGWLSWGQFRTLYEIWQNLISILDKEMADKMAEIMTYCEEHVNISVSPQEVNGTPDETSDQDSYGDVEGDEIIKEEKEINEEKNESDTDKDDIDKDDIDKEETNEPKSLPVWHKCIFRPGLYPDLDLLFEKMMGSQEHVDSMQYKAMTVIPRCPSFKIRDKTGFVTTHVRAEKLRTALDMKVMKMKSNSIVYTEELRNALCFLSDSQEQISKLTGKYLSMFQTTLYGLFERSFEALVKQVAELDVLQCSHTMMRKFRLVRPKISAQKGTLKIRQLRHLLIEQINQDTKYVPNDCLMGFEAEGRNTTGILLYGVNSCGKTSFLKSVGLAVVMAQAGLYVPAKTMEFSLCSRIMTRIAGSDNMERSQSSYIVELEELHSIIQRSDDETIILGDEMCRGTEVESANAMVFTTLKTLVSKSSLFVAATHLHDIAERVTNEMSAVKIYHMLVSFDGEGNVEYGRKLVDGPGPRLYGLEIAKAMNFPSEFMQEAMNFRNLQGTLNGKVGTNSRIADLPPVKQSTIRRSRYNAKKVLVKCECCGYKPQGIQSLPLDTHHIEFQCNADSEGYHDTQHKNALHNLVSVCKECHCKIHKNQLSVEMIQGVKAVKFIFKPVENVKLQII